MPNNYVLLETIALTQSAASVTFDNLPTSGYTDLKIVASVRSDVNSVEALVMSINGSTANFTYRFMDGGAGTPRSGTAKVDGIVNGTDYTASTFSSNEIYIPNYRSSNFKSFSVDYVTENNASAGYNGFTAGLWSQTAAITSLSFARANSGSLVAGSTFSLYGVAALGTTPVLAPKATGGNIVANDGTYWYHAFTSSGNFVPQVGLTADVLVIAGGGGSGGVGGGGGAGGLLLHSSQLLANATNYACTVGAGGTGGLYSTAVKGTNGGNSQFGSLTLSAGGGGGGTAQNANPGARVGFAGGSSGGSGGADTGGSYGTVSSQTPSPSGQGSAGGDGSSQTFGMGGGGGGGAGGAGAGGTYSSPATGGAGVSTYSSWGVATNTGQNISGTRWFAGGGGGYANYGNGGANPGGNGGGGDGDGNNPGLLAPGTANTGGGAGTKSTTGSAGGSGIIIIRYPIA